MLAHILRLRRTDKPGQHLLIHVSSTASTQLELKLIGTEHEHLYHARVQEGSIKTLQANNYSGDLQEWKHTLNYALRHEKPTDGDLPDFLQGLDTVAAISGNTLTITLRRNIGGITQRLGSIKLEQDDEREEVGAFEWVDSAVASSDTLRDQLEALQVSVHSQQDELAKLKQQLDDLVKAKKEHEDDMLKKFASLLNAKKLKIREQQRLLAGAKIDARVARDVSIARGSDRGHEAGVSRRGKRKGSEMDESEEQDDENDNDEALENDEVQQETPPRSGDESTEGEEEDDLDALTTANRAPPRAVKAPPRSSSQMEMDVDEQPPPIQEDDDDETDDEL